MATRKNGSLRARVWRNIISTKLFVMQAKVIGKHWIQLRGISYVMDDEGKRRVVDERLIISISNTQLIGLLDGLNQMCFTADAPVIIENGGIQFSIGVFGLGDFSVSFLKGSIKARRRFGDCEKDVSVYLRSRQRRQMHTRLLEELYHMAEDPRHAV